MRSASASLTFLLATVATSGQIPAPRAAPDIPPEKRALIKKGSGCERSDLNASPTTKET
jgi:hypothetical protein